MIISKEESYNLMCSKFDKAKMYDGRGTEDLYVCENLNCSNQLWSTYKDKGVTPFTIICNKCGKLMPHVKTLPIILFPVDIEWYRPSFEEFEKITEAEKHHILQGGLIKRIIT